MYPCTKRRSSTGHRPRFWSSFAILAGLEYLKDLSRSAHPIDQDRAVARAWGQAAWADYSGVSRTLTSLRQEEAEQIASVLHKITKLILDEEVMKALQLSGRLSYDGDLTGLRPLRRTDLLQGRLQRVSQERQAREGQVQAMEAKLAVVRAQEAETRQLIEEQRACVATLAAEYREEQRPERPYSKLGRARHKLGVLERRQARLAKKAPKLKEQLARRKVKLDVCQAQESQLRQRLEQFEADNRTNLYPIQADFRLDAGFGVRENVALLIEMGYEVYTKPYAGWLTPRLKRQATGRSDWTRVGKNAEMVAWKATTFHDFPYPLDVALERFWVGDKQKYATLLHFGTDPVTTDLTAWFNRYNARQTIEAGIKEGKGVFEMHHLKVRSAPALYLQEQFAAFAANFVRWAARWLATQCPQLPGGWQDTAQPKVREQVKVGAHTSAWVNWQEQGCLLRFTDHSIFAGQSLKLERRWAVQLPLPFAESSCLGHF